MRPDLQALRAPARGSRLASSAIARQIFRVCCAALFGSSAFAQTMTDPTRPPAGFAAPDAPEAGLSGGPVLQSVVISASGSAAIISGETVKLGQNYGEAVLVRIGESEVVLKGAGGTQVLKLYPGVEKRMARSQPAKPAPRRGTP